MSARQTAKRGMPSWCLVPALFAALLVQAESRAQMDCGSFAQAVEQVSLTVTGPLFGAAFGPSGDIVAAGVGLHFTEAPADIFERCWREATEGSEEEEEDDGYWDPHGILEEDDDDDDGDGWSWADPHLVTFDGLSFDFHGAGDYLLVDHARSDSVIHTRYTRAGDRRYSAQNALAIRVGDRRVTLYEGRDAQSRGVRVDGTRIDFQRGGWFEDDDLRIQRIDSWIYVRFSNGLAVATVSGRTNRIHLPSAWAGEVRGLLGNHDGDPANDVVRLDGTPVDPNDADALYGGYLQDWSLSADESLFAEPFDVANDGPVLPDAVPRLAELPADAVSAARELCLSVGLRPSRGLEACMFDVSLTGDESWATGDAALSGSVLTADVLNPNITRAIELADDVIAGALEAVGVAHEIEVPAAEADVTRILEAAAPCDSVLPAAVAVVIGGRPRAQRSLGCDTALELPDVAHSLLVTDPHGGTADYALRVLERAVDGLVDGGDLELDLPISIPMAANEQQWRWSLQDGTDGLFIQRADLERSDNSASSLCAARWSLLDADDRSVASGSLCIDAPRIDVAGATTLAIDLPAGVSATFLPGLIGAGTEIVVDLADRVRFDGVLGSPGQTDTYALQVEAGTSLLLMNEGGGNDCGVVWRVLENGTEVFRGASCFDTDPIPLPRGGDVQIVVDAGADPSSYGMDIIRVPGARSDELTMGEALDVSIETPGEMALLAFAAQAGDELLLADTVGNNDNCRIVWRVVGPFEPGGVADVIFQGPVCFDTEPIVLQRAGEYLLEVDGDRSATGAVSLTVFQVPEPRVEALHFGEEVDASIETPGARVRLTFDGNAGEEITLLEAEQGNDDCGIVWRILGPGGDEDRIFEGPVCFDSTPIALATSGPHVLEIDGQRSKTGNVGVIVERSQ